MTTSRHSVSGYAAVSQADQSLLQGRTQANSHIPQAIGNTDSISLSQYPQKQPEIHTEEISSTTEWRSWKLSWWFNSLFLVIELSFIISVIVLDHFSARDNGVVTVNTYSTSSAILNRFFVHDIQQYYGLLWTSLPSLVFTIYALTWAAIVATCYERQPFIELRRGASVYRTIMLDYRSYPSIYSWVIAFIHRHLNLGCGMLLSLIVSIIVVPLSARLFVVSASTHQNNVQTSFTAQFNDSIELGTTNLQPFIDIATAVHAYGSTPPAWMTEEYAFTPFSTTTASESSGNSFANLSATTDAYSAYADCVAMNSSSYTASYQDQGTDLGYSLGTVQVKFTDRTCSVQQTLAVTNNTPTYARSWYASCSGQTVNRIGVLTGTYSASSSNKLSNIGVISCIPSYWRTTGMLTVTRNTASSSTSNFISFTDQNSTAIQPNFKDTLEYGVNQYTIYNPAAATNANSFGFAILSAARRAANNNIDAAMSPALIVSATEKIFTTLYAALATADLLTTIPTSVTSSKSSGVLSEPVNRLFVVRPIAYTIIAVLLLVLVNHIVLWSYSARHKSVLSEEPIGLLGHAILLDRSDVGSVVRRVRTRYGEGPEVRDGLKKGFDIRRTNCTWDEHRASIKVEELIEK